MHAGILIALLCSGAWGSSSWIPEICKSGRWEIAFRSFWIARFGLGADIDTKKHAIHPLWQLLWLHPCPEGICLFPGLPQPLVSATGALHRGRSVCCTDGSAVTVQPVSSHMLASGFLRCGGGTVRAGLAPVFFLGNFHWRPCPGSCRLARFS